MLTRLDAEIARLTVALAPRLDTLETELATIGLMYDSAVSTVDDEVGER